MDGRFVGSVIIFSYIAILGLRYFLGPLGGVKFGFNCRSADYLPWTATIIVEEGF